MPQQPRPHTGATQQIAASGRPHWAKRFNPEMIQRIKHLNLRPNHHRPPLSYDEASLHRGRLMASCIGINPLTFPIWRRPKNGTFSPCALAESLLGRPRSLQIFCKLRYGQPHSAAAANCNLPVSKSGYAAILSSNSNDDG